MVWNALINRESSIDILFWNTFKQLDILEAELQPHDDSLFNFAGETVGTIRIRELYKKFGNLGSECDTLYPDIHIYIISYMKMWN